MPRPRIVDLRGPWYPEPAEGPPECRGCGRPLAELRREGEALVGGCANPACGERIVLRAVERRWVPIGRGR